MKLDTIRETLRPIAPPVKEYVLTLTPDEMEVFVAVMVRVSGDPFGPREVVDRFQNQAREAGVNTSRSFGVRGIQGSIHLPTTYPQLRSE